MAHHLGYDRDDPAGAGTVNSRNGSSTKTVSTTNGPVTLSVPRDRNGEFEPRIMPKLARRVGQIDEIALSCYARGMSTRDIEAHLLEVYSVKASREMVSNITDVVTDEIEICATGRSTRSTRSSTSTGSASRSATRARSRSRARTWSSASTSTGASTPGLLDRRDRGREVLALSPDPAAQPRAARHPDRLLRRPHRPPRRHRQHFPRHGRADLRRARRSQRDAVRVLPRP